MPACHADARPCVISQKVQRNSEISASPDFPNEESAPPPGKSLRSPQDAGRKNGQPREETIVS